jgi:chromosomal replication initiation ATPase DnaA
MPAIGRAFDRDDTTILHATRRIPQRMALHGAEIALQA